MYLMGAKDATKGWVRSQAEYLRMILQDEYITERVDFDSSLRQLLARKVLLESADGTMLRVSPLVAS